MRYTEKQRAEFKAAFIQKRRYQVAGLVPLAGTVLLGVLSVRYVPDLAAESGTIAFGMLGLVLAAAVFAWFNWRCPACAKFLGWDLSPSECRSCRVALGPRKIQ